jgi:hypothetical protein
VCDAHIPLHWLVVGIPANTILAIARKFTALSGRRLNNAGFVPGVAKSVESAESQQLGLIPGACWLIAGWVIVTSGWQYVPKPSLLLGHFSSQYRAR